MQRLLGSALVLGMVGMMGSGEARGQPSPPQPAGDDEYEGEGDEFEDEGEGASVDELPQDLPTMARRLRDLELKLAQAEETRRNAASRVRVSGYGDVGFFWVQGDGSGVRRDIGYVAFPDRSNFGWVFYGDLLATQVNTRGEVADLGELPGVTRFDSINAEDHPTFLVNELNLSIQAGLSASALFTASVNFMPRTGREFSLGDFVEVDIVQLEWLPTADQRHSFFIGKVDSVIGHEYKQRKANQRFGITPTLVHRYTAGTAVGLKARSKWLGDRLILAAALTNGSFGTEQFHFYDEIDSNDGKTVSGRAALRIPLGSGSIEVGGSGQVGAQDTADGAGTQWLLGVDAEILLGALELRAQWLTGKAPGDPVSEAYALELKQGGYLEATLRLGRFGFLARGELRDAEVWQDPERLYITKSWRAVAGARMTFGTHVIAKIEGVHNGEYGAVPSIPNSLVTSSLVVLY